MVTFGIMGLLVVFLGYLLLIADYHGRKSEFFDIASTSSLRGFWCLIVLLVHIPPRYQNPIQNMLGSFAYIGVTFFFMTSAYGLFVGINKNPYSVIFFWRRRLLKLLMPMFVSNFLSVIVKCAVEEKWNIFDLVRVTSWVSQLLIFYGIFWIVFVAAKNILSCRYKKILFCFLIMLFSLLAYFGKSSAVQVWPTEAMGFLYGTLLYWCGDRFKQFAEKRWVLKCIAMCGLSLVIGVAYLKCKQYVFCGDYLLKIVLGFMILAFMFLWYLKRPIGNKVSRFLGKISYEVYLLHGTSFAILTSFFENWNSAVFIVVSILLVVILASGVHYFCLPILKKWEKRCTYV